MTKSKTDQHHHRLFLAAPDNIFQYLQEQANYFGISIQEYLRHLIMSEMRIQNSVTDRQPVVEEAENSKKRFTLSQRLKEDIKRALKQREDYKYKSIGNEKDIRELLDNPKFIDFGYYNED